MSEQSNMNRALEHLELGNRFQEEHPIRAMDEWKEAVRLNPQLTEAHLNLGVAYADQGDLDRAVEELGVAYRLDPENEEVRREYLEALNERGVQAGEKGNPEQAMADWHMALEVDPANADAHANLGAAFGDSGNLDEAETHLRKAVEANPVDLETRERLASLLIEKGKPDAAAHEIREALVIGSRFGQSLASPSTILPIDAQFDGERYERNASLLEQADTHLSAMARMLADICLERGEMDQAVAALEQASFAPEDAPRWLRIGEGYLKENRPEDAVLALRRSYQADPATSQARALMDQLGVSYDEPPAEEELEEEETGDDEDRDQV